MHWKTKQFCSKCGREKDWYFDPAYGGFTEEFCSKCDGVTGFLRRLLFGVDRVSPMPHNHEVCELSKRYRVGEITLEEYENKITEVLND
jgi:hypothetical protein